MNVVGRISPIRISKAKLDPGIRAVLEETREALGPYGWTIRPERIGHKLGFEFSNPLSPVSTAMEFESNLAADELRQRVADHIKQEPEIAATQRARAPKRRRELLRRLRWAATRYEWPPEVFGQVIDTLHGVHALSDEETQWLTAVGPDALVCRLSET